MYETFSRLKQKYYKFNKSLDQTGAGLLAEKLKEDVNLHNLVGKNLFSNSICVLRSTFGWFSILGALAWLLANAT